MTATTESSPPAAGSLPGRWGGRLFGVGSRWRLPAWRSRAERDIWMTGLMSVVVLTGLIVYAMYSAHKSAIADWSERIDNLSTALAEHAAQTLGSGDTVLSAIGATVAAQHFQNQAAYQAWARAPEQYRVLLAAKQANSLIDVVTFVANNGEVLNFSRSYPAPQISLADRSYFKAHTANAQLGLQASEPVANKGNGKWLFYLSRRINDERGEMLGLVLVGMSVDTFSQIYEKVARNLGEGAVVSLLRDDFMLMARWPPAPGTLGGINRQGASYQLLSQPGRNSGVVYTEAASAFRPQGGARLASPHRVPGYPFIVTSVVTAQRYLQRWYSDLQWAVALWAFTMATIAGTLFALLRSVRRARRLQGERRAVEQALARASDDFELRIDGRTAALREDIAAHVTRERELAVLHARLVALSHQAGMAEVASSVLHNVGNVLNSLNTSSSVIAQKLQQTPLQDLPRAAELAQSVLLDPAAAAAHPAQARQLADFLQLLAGHWRDEHQVLLRESDLMRRRVEHIRDIISRQQSVSGHSGLIERFAPADLLAEVVQMHEGALQRSEVTVQWGTLHRQPWLGDRGKFIQICLNLIKNAEQALAASPQTERRLTVSCELQDDGQLRVQVTDNGSGISTATLSRLFTYGYTTKAGGHGLGLHASALAAQSMGGALDAFSRGEGQGATFTLSLPQTAEALLET